MSLFTGQLTITQVDINWRLWWIEQPLVYEVGAKGSGKTIAVPKGFLTDGASIPQFLWSMLPTWGAYSRAAVIHDYLYRCIGEGRPHSLATTRKAADDIFLEAMAVCGVTIGVRNTIYTAVRTFGSIDYDKPVINDINQKD